MHASPESASANKPEAAPASSALIVGVNWLGDSIMTMPALQAYRRAHPLARLTLLVKANLEELWRLHPAVNEILIRDESAFGVWRMGRRLRRRRFDRAFVLPHSFRSALIPFLAGIPERAGMPGHQRDWMLTRVVRFESSPTREHQGYEYLQLMGLPQEPMEPPRIVAPADTVASAHRRLGPDNRPVAGLIPGAAFGRSKQWPAEFFAQAGRILSRDHHCRILVFGSASERELGARVTDAIGASASNLAGETSLTELTAMLSLCSVVITNDSGGMHLAAAAGAPVVAVYGITDPAKTGPMSPCACVLQDSAIRGRDLDRDAPRALESLRRIAPERAVEAAVRAMARTALGTQGES